MQRLDLSYFYRLSLRFDSVRQLDTDGTFGDIWFELYAVREALQQLFNDPTMKGCFRSSLGAATALHRQLASLIDDKEWGEKFTALDKAQLVGLMDKFEIIMTSELGVTDTYIVVDKPPYSTVGLITEGESLFPPDLSEKVPEAVQDMKEAGKCLAFELTTACGFHTLRAVEAVLRRYWEAVTGNLPKPKQRNIGVYLNGLKTAGCGDPKVISALTQLKDLHRNVIFHPEENLDVEQAISLLGITRSVVAEMLKALPVVVQPVVNEPQKIDFSSDVATDAAAVAADAAAEATRAAEAGGQWEEFDPEVGQEP